MKDVTNKKDNRNYGLDILRIVSMFMVLIIHYIGRSNLTSLTNNTTYNWYIYNFILAIALVANNCYVLISGYFLINSKFKIKKVLQLILESWFYSIGITMLLYFLGYYKFSTRGIIEMIFPLLTKKYWFLSFYIVLYILFPFMNKGIKSFTKKELKTLIIILLIIFSVLGGTIQKSLYAINSEGSFSFIWFLILYIIGSYVRMYEIKYKKKYILLGLLSAIIVTTLNILKTKFNILGSFEKFYQTTNFFIFIESITLFLFFKDLKMKGNLIQKTAVKIAPLTLAVYLIHQTPALDAILYNKILHTNICYNNKFAILITFSCVLLVFILLLFIESIRQYLSKKIVELVKNTNVYNKIKSIYIRVSKWYYNSN